MVNIDSIFIKFLPVNLFFIYFFNLFGMGMELNEAFIFTLFMFPIVSVFFIIHTHFVIEDFMALGRFRFRPIKENREVTHE